jgi:hypothetical protein
VLIVRRMPPRGVRVRSALTTLESLAALLIAHLAAGGALPSLCWVLAAAPAAYVASWLVLSGRASIRLLLPGLVGVQLFGHVCLEALATHDHAAHGEATFGLSPAMLIAHVAAGAVTTLAWVLRRRVAEFLTWWWHRPRIIVLRPRPSAIEVDPALPVELLLAAAPTRGPPSSYLLAA